MAEEQEQKRTVVLTEQRFSLSEYLRQDWVVNAEEGTTVEDVVDPAYWALVAVKMKPWDRIEVRLETGDWLLELLVVHCDRNWARVHVLEKYDLGEAANQKLPDQAIIWKYRGPQHKHCAVRESDGAVLQSGMDSREAVNAWIATYQRRA